MSNTTKIILGVVVLALVVWGVVALSGPEPAIGETITLGVIAPFTGDTAFFGEGIRDAVELAQDELGETQNSYRVIFEDDELDVKKTAGAANKLINIDGVDALISFSSGSGNVVSPLAQNSGVIHFGIGSDATIAEGRYNFLHWTPPEEEAKVLVDELRSRNISRVAVFVLQQQGATAQVDAFEDAISGTDIQIVAREKFPFGTTDFRTVIQRAARNNPEIMLIVAFTPELEILARQIRDLGISVPLTSMEAFELTEQYHLFEGEWYVNAADATEEFRTNFNDSYGKNPPLGAANSYDIFNLLVEAYEDIETDSEDTNELAVENLLEIKSFKGALGDLAINSEGIVISEAEVKEIRNGKPRTIRR